MGEQTWLHLLQGVREAVIEVVQPEAFLQPADLGVGVDNHQLNPCHLGEVFHVLGGHSQAEARVMRARILYLLSLHPGLSAGPR